MNTLVLLYVRELFKRLVAVVARVLADVGVDEGVLRQLLGGREGLEAQDALVMFLLGAMSLLGVTLHVRLVLKLLPRTHNTADMHKPFNEYQKER